MRNSSTFLVVSIFNILLTSESAITIFISCDSLTSSRRAMFKVHNPRQPAPAIIMVITANKELID